MQHYYNPAECTVMPLKSHKAVNCVSGIGSSSRAMSKVMKHWLEIICVTNRIYSLLYLLPIGLMGGILRSSVCHTSTQVDLE